MNNEINHYPGSAIRGDLCDNITISNNVVYGKIWQTTSGFTPLYLPNHMEKDIMLLMETQSMEIEIS